MASAPQAATPAATPQSPAAPPAQARPPHATLQYPLSAQQCSDYGRDGFLILRGRFSAAEAAAWQRAASALQQASDFDPANLRYDLTTTSGGGDPSARVIWKIDPFHELHVVFRRLVRDRRICDALASLYQGREPRLFKDKLIIKPPHTHGNQLHQDYTWWQGFPHSLISVLIAVEPANESNGCTVLYPGRHRAGLLTAPGQFAFPAPELVAGVTPMPVVTQPGDLALFGCFTPHEAGPNNSEHPRCQIFLTYNDSGDGEHYQAHYQHYARYVLESLPEDARASRYLA